MRPFLKTQIFLGLCCLIPHAQAQSDACCNAMDGISYCDSSSGRYVCKNGDFSSCYCTPHAIMDMQKFSGCCLWKGGILKVAPEGTVICRNGSVSELCGDFNKAETSAGF